jgi:H+/Cl- antiporter ClcA
MRPVTAAGQEEQQPLGGTAYLRLVAFAAVIGIPTAFAAALFLAVVHDLEHWLWTDLPDRLGHTGPPWYLVLALPVVGAAIVVVAPEGSCPATADARRSKA